MAEVRGDLAVKNNLATEGNAVFSKGVDLQYLEVLDVKTAGTAGGAANANQWVTRDLSSVIFNDFATAVESGAADLLAGDPATPGDGGQITIPAGLYYTEIECPALNVNEHVARLADVTDNPGLFGSTVILGTTEFAADTEIWRDSADGAMLIAGAGQTRSKICGRFELSRSTVLEIQHRVANTQTGDGFGSDGAFYLTDNVFTTVKMWQVRDDE
jgi:hypothetical protein